MDIGQMQSRNHSRIISPIIGQVSVLNNKVLLFTNNVKNCIRHPYLDEIKKDCILLFKYAYRQTQGKDYYRRSVELIEEIQAQAYLVRALGGFGDKECVEIDVICDEILRQLNAIKFSSDRNAKPNGEEQRIQE